jgi:5-methyltetrahydropteroyltriglutamate--homocysteine methyltransferase
MLEGLPRDRVRLHVCYGNYESPHDKDVPLEYILPSLLEANVGGFLFPFR